MYRDLVGNLSRHFSFLFYLINSLQCIVSIEIHAMSSSDKEDPWTEFLREELIRVRTGAQYRMSSTIAPSSTASNVMRDPETPTVQTDFESDHDHETVIVTNKTKLKRPNTPETIKESPQSSPTHSSPPAPSHIIIDRPGIAQRSGFLSCINQNKGIIIIAVLIYLFAATGFGGFLLEKFLGIPSLNREISQLTTQVDRLSLENKVLQGNIINLTLQVDRQATLNTELAANATYLESQVNQTQALVQTLNSSLAIKEILNNQLQAQVVAYQKSLTDANKTLLNLSTLNNNLNNQVDTLNITLDNFTLANSLLKTQVNNLSSSVSYLNNTVFQLNNEVDQLENQTTKLKTLNNDLGILVSFLNITTNQNAQVYEDFIGYLANQITIYRGLVAMDLELYYRSFIDNWSSDFTSRFGTYPFGVDDTLPFGSYYSDVITRIYTKDLGYLCINRTDFEQYLFLEILPPKTNLSETNLQDLEEAVSTYSAILLSYYFPVTRSILDYGVKVSDWETATWSCENLPPSLLFTYEKYINWTSTLD